MKMFHRRRREERKFTLKILDNHQRRLGEMTDVQELQAAATISVQKELERQVGKMQAMGAEIKELKQGGNNAPSE